MGANPMNCRITFHDKRTRDGIVTGEGDYWFNLRDVQNFEVRTGEQIQRKAETSDEQPSVDIGGSYFYDSEIAPAIFVLVPRRTGNAENYFIFTDADTADRVAKAMVHAVELCGGGNKDPF